MSKESFIGKIASQFALDGVFVGEAEIHSGHINATYIGSFKKECGEVERYIFQRINGYVFKDPLAVMENVARVTEHIRKKAQSEGQVLSLYPAKDGKLYVAEDDGGLWRCYNFIEGCITHDVVENTDQAYQAARAFGTFQDLVSDISMGEIKETIPDFHHTPKRYQRLMDVVEEDSHGRVDSVRSELDFIKQRQVVVSKLRDLMLAGDIPERVTHNDTKINNVMMDEDSDEAVCVIDLDTVMPGLSLYDFGDLVRTAVSPAAEDEQDLQKVQVRMPIFEALAKGYMEACSCLCEAEIENLVFSGKLISLEVAIRFLTDYLEGDVYFKTHHEGHNLERARTQLKLVEQIEAHEPEMEQVVSKLAKSLRA